MGAKESRQPRLELSVYLLSGLLMVGSAWTAWLAQVKELSGSTISAALLAVVGAAGLLLPGYLRRKTDLREGLLKWLRGPYGPLLPLGMLVVLCSFFLIIQPDAELALVFGPVLAAFWAAGAGISLLAARQPERLKASGQTRAGGVVVVSALLLYGILLIPAKLPGLLDGLPWDTPLEFGLALLGIPLALTFAGRFLTRKWVVVSLLALLTLKIGCMLLLPQPGLVVRAYQDGAAFKAGNWERSYASFFSSEYTQLMTSPYNRLREFPIEWINDRFGYDTQNFRLILELHGYARLKNGERLAFWIEGAKQADISLIDPQSGTAYPAIIVSTPWILSDIPPESTDQPGTLEVQGVLSLDHFGQARLEPIIVESSGAWRPALQALKIWPSLSGTQASETKLAVFRALLSASDLIFVAILVVCSTLGIYRLWKQGRLATLELYAAASAIPAFLVAQLVPNSQFNLLVIPIILVIGALAWVASAAERKPVSSLGFLAGTGILFLVLFLSVDMGNLRSVTSFPQWQDGIEYQTFARKIYLEGDVLLKNTPPRAYKVLFPYIAGALHVLFGQSTAAQLFLSAWCAILSGMFILKLGEHFKIPASTSYPLAVYYLLILCTPLLYITYFRFGLIESFATLLLLATMYLATQQRMKLMALTGALTLLLRLDYLGITTAAFVLTSTELLGALRQAWQSLLAWLSTRWKVFAEYLATLIMLPTLIIAGYFVFIPGYYLNASDTQQTSLTSVIESMARVIIGGTSPELVRDFAAHPADLVLISAPLAIGFLLALGALLVRRGLLSRIDMRLALLIPSLLPAYLVVRPAAYFPRFSLPLLPLDLLLIALVFQHILRERRRTSEPE